MIPKILFKKGSLVKLNYAGMKFVADDPILAVKDEIGIVVEEAKLWNENNTSGYLTGITEHNNKSSIRVYFPISKEYFFADECEFVSLKKQKD